MTAVRYVDDPEFVVPLRTEVMSDSARAQWAREAVAATVRRHGADVVRSDLATEFAARAQARIADEGSAGVLLYAPAWRVWTAVRIAVSEVEPTPEEIDAFVRPPALLPPQVRATPDLPVGRGVSSTVLVSASPALGAVRWLFVPPGHSIRVDMTPVAAPAVTAVAALVEVFLTTLRIDGVDGDRAAAFDPARLVSPLDAEGRNWPEWTR
ncbi:hypothetical protein [Microbacterium thalli]|uniref:PhiE125 gp8 family phage protein n=1 Tax=Microbacterium thalli TaxID=3027921 RepID=A0ABT5SN16_9MICO|nr:hypothetical protein [Microbacterium thalli]MDD7927973.1 hypothetical protein [Microbacterium thalli]MDD7963183.1 hypothetical protein [Microbacterium thalli]MDN8548118.1 hypothetical protein [Microbacterium thalli]